MKKLISILCAVILFGGLNLQASPVSPTRALDIAKKIFASQPATKAGTGEVKIIWDGEDVATKSVQPAFYVITRDGGGFVIIAGDNNVQPILAISDRNEFKVEGMPKNVRAWMEYMKGYVRSAKTQTTEIGEQWAQMVATKALSGTFTNINDYSKTCEWSQSAPANLQAPTVTGQGSQAVAGCLPLAIAEIMTWHKSGTGTGSSVAYSYTSANSQTVNIAAYDLTTAEHAISTDNWTAFKALDTYAKFSECTGDTRTKLSHLVYACGVLLKAQFNAGGIYGGTSSSSSDVVAAFGEHMGYNKGAYRDFLANHSLREWVSKLKTEIALRPVLYCGQSSIGGNDAGHAYVFDGFATLNGTDDVFHVNFGWGGSCNGYYYAAYQDTRPEQNYNYNMDLEALFGFYPKAGSQYQVQLEASYSSDSQPGIRAESNAYGYLIYYNINNRSAGDYSGKIKFVQKKKDGTETLLVGGSDNPLVFSMPSGYSGGGYCGYFPISSISFGDKVICYYKDGEDWKLLGCIAGSAISEWPLTPAAFIKTKATYNKNEWFQFELMNNDYIYSDAKWTITAPDGTITSNIPQSDYEFQLTQTGKYKIEVKTATENIVTYITVN